MSSNNNNDQQQYKINNKTISLQNHHIITSLPKPSLIGFALIIRGTVYIIKKFIIIREERLIKRSWIPLAWQDDSKTWVNNKQILITATCYMFTDKRFTFHVNNYLLSSM